MIGTFAIFLSFFSGLLSVMGYVQAALGKKRGFRIGRVGLYVSAFGIILASALLLKDILNHNFENAYVWSYSSINLPLHFLFSSFWAGQEGSFLFWVFCSALLSIFLLAYTSKRNLEAHVLSIFLAVQTFLVLLLIAKSPFKTIYEQFPGELTVGQPPHDGRGLNLLLQNFWMVIHPPILFIGFAAMAIPFSFAISALWRKEYHSWLTSAFPWVLFSGLTLGLGLMLGAYWAYGVLGWGGYWGWDPVENSSLIPWLISMALLHTMLAQARTGNLVRTNFIFAILSFVLVIYSTFLTRSGILGDSSVHSFTDPGTFVYSLLLVFLLGSIALGFGFMILRRSDLKSIAKPMHWLTREFALSIGSFALLASAVFIFFGTSLPLFSTTHVETSFYNTTNYPIAVLISLLIGFSLLVRWEQEDGMFLKEKSWKALLGAVLGTLVIAFFSSFNAKHMLIVFTSLFALFVNLELVYLTAKGNFRMMGGKIAHSGLAIFLIGVIISGNYDEKKTVQLELNVPQNIFGRDITYTGREIVEGNKTQFSVTVVKDGNTTTLHPLMFEAGEQGVMRNPDIESFFTHDIYISPNGLEEGTTSGNGTITIKKEESVTISGAKITFVGFDMKSHDPNQNTGENKIGVILEITSGYEKETVIPYVIVGGSEPKYFSAQSKIFKGKIQLLTMSIGGMGDGKSGIEIALDQTGKTIHSDSKEVLTVEASVKPFISLVWIGTILLFLGFMVSIQRRKKADSL